MLYVSSGEQALKILFIGALWHGSNATSLARGFASLGASVRGVDISEVSVPKVGSRAWIYSKREGVPAPWLLSDLEKKIDRAARDFRPDLLFCFNTMKLGQAFLQNVAFDPMKVHYSPDDVSNKTNTTEDYLAHEAEWDAVVTTKIHNIDELYGRGVKNPIFVLSAYDPAWHHASYRVQESRWDISFIGNYRPDRAPLLLEIAREFPGSLVIAGPRWRRHPAFHKAPLSLLPPSFGEDFSVFIASSECSLVLLNSDNRDTHTCRSFEVPAAAGLFIGQRTTEHQGILEEGSESLLFSSREELFEQIRMIRSDPARAQAIRMAGHRRIVGDRHTYQDRANEILIRLGFGV